MSIHRPHPITGDWNGKTYDDDKESILFDSCDRCAELAEHLFLLDREKLHRLFLKTTEVEYDQTVDYYTTVNEANAARNLFSVFVIIERLFGLKLKQTNAGTYALDPQRLG